MQSKLHVDPDGFATWGAQAVVSVDPALVEAGRGMGMTEGEVLRGISTGARFDAITRGVIDLRDLVYYLSLTVIFLSLNVYNLERERWSLSGGRSRHRH